MGIENVQAVQAHDPIARYGLTVPDSPKAPDQLDAPEIVRLHGKVHGTYQYERNRQSANRYQMALDHDYYDSIQLDDEDLAELTDRGQPPLVYNLVKRVCDWIIGTEKRTRIDFKVLGRNKDEREVTGARVKSDILKYLNDVNKTPFMRSQAFKLAVISGLAWLEDGVRADPEEELIYSGWESWRNLYHDSHDLSLDGSGAMYMHRAKWLDLEVAQAMFPERGHLITTSSIGAIEAEDAEREQYYLGNRISGQDYLAGMQNRYATLGGFHGYLDNSRDRVRLIESWFRRPVRDRVMIAKQLPRFHGERYNPQNDDMRHALLIGDATVVDRVRMAVYYMIATESHVLAMGRSPYRHNQFPFTPIYCYRRGRDNAPYGVVRGIRDPQDGFNRRMSKSIHVLSAYRVTMDSDAVDPKVMSYEDVRREAGRPDALIVKRAGKDIKVEQDRGLAEGHMRLAEQEAGLILDSSGVTADNLGMESNAQSGKAIIAKQSEGAAVTAEIFDNLRFANQIQGEKQLSLAEQYMTEERVIRITDYKGRPSWTKVNEIVDDPASGQVRVLNDLTATKSDFVIDQQDYNTSLRQAASEQLMDMAAKMAQFDPKIGLRIMDMAIDQSNLPDKDDMLKQIREITGFAPPEDALTPEEKQQLEQQQQQAQRQAQQEAQQQQDAFMADLKAKQAEAELKLAQADKARAEAQTALQGLQAQPGMPPEVQQQIESLQQAHQQAQEQVAQHASEVQTLQQQLKDRAAEFEAQKYVADREAEAAKHAADRQAEAQLGTANAQYPAGSLHPQTEETLADVLQAVAEMRQALEQMKKQADAEDKAEQKKEKVEDDRERRLLEQIKSMIEASRKEESPKAEKREDAPELKAILELGAQIKELAAATHKAIVANAKPAGPRSFVINGKPVTVGEVPTKKPRKEK